MKFKKLVIIVTVFSVLIFLPLLLFVYFNSAYTGLDPDFGWRLKTGELIVKQGIPKTDPFTYTMSSFPFVDHAWLVSLAFYKLFPLIGKAGLAIAVSLIAVFALILSTNRYKNNKWTLDFLGIPQNTITKRLWFGSSFAFILSAAIFLFFVGVRAQVTTWLMTSVLFMLVLNEKLWQKVKYATPLLFLFWANIHGGYASGLVFLVFVIVLRSIRIKKILYIDLAVFLVSMLVTLINPYGLGSWREVWSSISDSSLRFSISEWIPSLFVVDFAMVTLYSTSTMLVLSFRKKFTLEEKGAYLAFLLASLSSRRHLPLWVLFALPMTNKALVELYLKAKKIKFGEVRFKFAYKFIWLLALLLFAMQSTIAILGASALSENKFYPGEAVNYLKAHNFGGNIFSDYGWGGYLIWQYPEKKVFVDGRMPSWQWNAPEGESSYVFDEYKNILSGDMDYKSTFEKFDIKVVLIPPERPLPFSAQMERKFQNFINRLIGKENKDFIFYKQLLNDGWLEIYSDETAVVLIKV